MTTKPPQTLADMCAQLDLIENPGLRARYLGKVRAACARRGEPVPDWAALPPPPPDPLRVAMGDALFFELPSALAGWRRAEAGRVVTLGNDGAVRLVRYDSSGRMLEARFGDIGEAVGALAEPETVAWVARRRQHPEAHNRRACA